MENEKGKMENEKGKMKKGKWKMKNGMIRFQVSGPFVDLKMGGVGSLKFWPTNKLDSRDFHPGPHDIG